MLRNGCSNAVAVLGEHLAKNRGKFETSYCQKVTVEGEEICTRNVIVIISNWNNPFLNPLPRYENVDGLTLRYKHRGQPENRQQPTEPNQAHQPSLYTSCRRPRKHH